MISILPHRKRFIVVSCTHGEYLDPVAANELMKFKADWKPDLAIHLGDFMDTRAFRRGAGGTPDAGSDISQDVKDGTSFLQRYEPNLIFCGNHEDRLWQLVDHPNAIVQHAARSVKQKIEQCADDLHAELVEYKSIASSCSWRLIGGTAFGHGFMYNENAGRDHAEYLGCSVVFGHTHKIIQQPGRSRDDIVGYSVGTLCQIPAMAYAKSRRATTAWQLGWGYGEYTDKEDSCTVNLYVLKRGKAETAIPVAAAAQTGTPLSQR